ncbi:retrovirus-related pol polyprotein from transposon TNT 1-94 [Tanacetum coccineum]
MLVYISATCPSSKHENDKLIVVTPINKTRTVRFAESRVSSSTEASGSKPRSNTKKYRITQTSSSNKKKNKHSVLNVNSELICTAFHECMFDAINDLCVHDCLNDVLARVVQIVLWYLDSGCSKHMTGQRSQLINSFSKFLGTVRFGNDQIAKIMGYDAFRKHTCYVRNLDGADLISGSRDTNLYTISLDDMLKSSLIYLLSKASKTKSWLWHRRLSHINFGTLNQLAKQCLVRGLPKLKFEKDHLCSACSLGKSKKYSHKPKVDDTNQEKLDLLHIDLCGPMRVESINGKKYILIFVDDYSRFRWVKFLRSKDKTLEVIIKCLKQIQVRLNATVKNVRTDNGTEFVNQTLKEYYENTPYELMHEKKPDLSFIHVFGSLCYPTNDREDLGKLKPKADIGIFVGYASAKKAI